MSPAVSPWEIVDGGWRCVVSLGRRKLLLALRGTRAFVTHSGRLVEPSVRGEVVAGSRALHRLHFDTTEPRPLAVRCAKGQLVAWAVGYLRQTAQA